MARVLPLAATWVLYWGLWMLFAGTLDPQEAIAGLIIAGAVALMTKGAVFGDGIGILHPVRFAYLVLYLPYLFVEIIKANLQVARIVVDPALPIRPAIVRVMTRLQSPVGRMILANSITLTPGTLSVEMEGDTLFIHWIVTEAEDIDGATAAIVSGFEDRLEKIFG